jgi:hypothetical protein
MVQLASQFTPPVGGGSSISAAGAGRCKNGRGELRKDSSPAPLTCGRQTIWLIGALANVAILPIAFEPIDRQSDK